VTKVTKGEPSTIKSNLQKLQTVKKVTKSEKGRQKQPRTTVGFWWSNNLQPLAF
jgi:hypothetical protein